MELAGKPIAQWSRSDLARTVGVVTQREESVFALTVAEMVLLGAVSAPWRTRTRRPRPIARRCVPRSSGAMPSSLHDRATDTLSRR